LDEFLLKKIGMLAHCGFEDHMKIGYYRQRILGMNQTCDKNEITSDNDINNLDTKRCELKPIVDNDSHYYPNLTSGDVYVRSTLSLVY
jgi:hypothetical protein